MEPYRQINLRLQAKTSERLKAACHQSGASVSEVLRSLIDTYITKAADELAIRNQRLAVFDQRTNRLSQANVFEVPGTMTSSPFFGYIDAHED